MSRLGFSLLLLLVFLAALAGGGWLLRVELVQAAAERWLAAEGIPARLTVVAVEPDRLALRDVSLGRRPTVTAGRIALALAWPQLGAPRLERLSLADATVRLDLAGGPLLGELQSLLEDRAVAEGEADAADAADAAPGPPLIPLEAENLTILADTAIGPARMRIDGQVRPADAGIAADLTLQGTTPVAVFGGRLQAQGKAARLERLDADLRFAAEAEGLDGRVLAAVADLPAAPQGQVTVDLTAGPRAARLLAPLLPHALSWDGLQLTARLDGRAAPLTGAPWGKAPWLTWAAAGDWTGGVTLTAQRLAWPGVFERGEVLLALDATQAQGRLAVLPAETAELSLTGISPDVLRGLGLPDDLVERGRAGVRLRLLPLAPDLPLLVAERGTAAVSLDPALRVALESGAAAAVAALRGYLVFDNSLDLQFVDLSEFNLSASDWSFAGQRLQSAAVAGRLSGPPRELGGAFDLNAEVAPQLPSGQIESLRVTWPSRFAADLPAASLRLDGLLQLSAQRLAWESLQLARLDAALDATLEVGREGGAERAPGAPARLRLSAPGSLVAEALRLDGRRIDRLRAEIEQQEATWSAAGGVAHRLTARWAPLALQVAQNGRSLLEADIEPGLWSVEGTRPPGAPYDGRFALTDARVGLSEPALALERLELRGPLPPRPDRALELGARLRHAAATPLLPPLDLTGTLQPEAGGYAVAVTGRGLDGALSAVLRAQVRPQAPTLEGTLTVAPLAFSPGGVQPADLTPVLEGLEGVSGRLGASASLAWTPAGQETAATLRFEDLDFGYDRTLRVSGLAGTIAFAALTPPQAPPPQVLTAERLEAGLALTDLTAEVALLPDGPEGAPRLQIITASAATLGGRLMLREGLVDPAAGRQEARLVLQEIDLAALLDFLNAEDVDASGVISGEIPLLIEGETVTVRGGRLRAERPGVLQVTSQAARQALAQGGERVELLMQALENFQYEDLALTLDKPAAGSTRATLRLVGQNPAVLDGQPFDVTVNLETDLAPILLALSEALKLTEGAVERLWKLQR